MNDEQNRILLEKLSEKLKTSATWQLDGFTIVIGKFEKWLWKL
jgi:hypothetical protein